MSTPNTTFHLFPKLPIEIRLMIWRECLPNRVMELDHQQDELLWDEDDDPPCMFNWKISRTNNAPPLITLICRESRAVAFESGSRQPSPDPRIAGMKDILDFSKYMLPRPWLDKKRDAVHVNWEPWADIEWETYDWGDPIRCIMWHAARTKPQQASIMISLLKVFQNLGDNPTNPHHFRWTRSELADLMRTWPCWRVVVLPPMIIHTNVETAAGFFGLLSDARLQLVAADDEAGIDRFLALGGRTDATVTPEFREQLLVAKKELRDAVKAVFESEERTPIMQPFVMFRLCTRFCK
ncbi:2EXR domain-containing protein, partial [Aspergillus foveolatus]|uniref:2EXR domain-containing protein n=1 Tax=Aspergillus foveolatus TaxID=210207 RepID=UPI003CCCA73D